MRKILGFLLLVGFMGAATQAVQAQTPAPARPVVLKAENFRTLVVLCADHGEMNGEGALVDKGAYLNPRVLRVPLFLKEAAGADSSAGELCDTPVSLLDLAPTMLGAAGIAPVAPLDGVDLRATLEGRPRPPERPILFEAWSHVLPKPCVGGLFRLEAGDVLYSFNAADMADEVYQRPAGGAWDCHDVSGEADAAPVGAKARSHLFEALRRDPRRVSWESFFRLRHWEDLEAGAIDLQRFVE